MDARFHFFIIKAPDVVRIIVLNIIYLVQQFKITFSGGLFIRKLCGLEIAFSMNVILFNQIHVKLKIKLGSTVADAIDAFQNKKKNNEYGLFHRILTKWLLICKWHDSIKFFTQITEKKLRKILFIITSMVFYYKFFFFGKFSYFESQIYKSNEMWEHVQTQPQVYMWYVCVCVSMHGLQLIYEYEMQFMTCLVSTNTNFQVVLYYIWVYIIFVCVRVLLLVFSLL